MLPYPFALLVLVIIMCMHSALIGGEWALLEWAHDLKLMGGAYILVPYDALVYSLCYKHTSLPGLEEQPETLGSLS